MRHGPMPSHPRLNSAFRNVAKICYLPGYLLLYRSRVNFELSKLFKFFKKRVAHHSIKALAHAVAVAQRQRRRAATGWAHQSHRRLHAWRSPPATRVRPHHHCKHRLLDSRGRFSSPRHVAHSSELRSRDPHDSLYTQTSQRPSRTTCSRACCSFCSAMRPRASRRRSRSSLTSASGSSKCRGGCGSQWRRSSPVLRPRNTRSLGSWPRREPT